MKYLLIFIAGIVTGIAVWVYSSMRVMREYEESVNNFWRAYTGTPEVNRLTDDIIKLQESLKKHARNGR